MKKLILIICLSVTGIIISGDKYPYISKHYPTESRVPQQCQENDPAKWGDIKATQIALNCKELEKDFFLMIKAIDQNTSTWDKIKYKGSVHLLAAKRDWIRKMFSNKKNQALMRQRIDRILEPLDLCEFDKQKEEKLAIEYLLMAAEYE